MLLIHYLHLSCQQSGAKPFLISGSITKNTVVPQWVLSRETHRTSWMWDKCMRGVGFGKQQPSYTFTPNTSRKCTFTLSVMEGSESQPVFPSFSSLQTPIDPKRGVFFSFFYNVICYALGGARCSFVLGFFPSSTSGRQLRCWRSSCIPQELTNSILLLLLSWAFPRTHGAGQDSPRSVKGSLPGNRAIY